MRTDLFTCGATQLAILDALKVGVSVIDRSYNIRFVNKEMIERGWVPENVLNTPCYRTYNGDLGVCPGCPAQEVFRTGKEREAIQKGKDGHYYEVIASPIASPDGEVAFVAEITRDVTALFSYRKRLESLYKAVDRLIGILPVVVMRLGHEERVELIRTRIQELLTDLLPYDNLVVDLLDRETNRLDPLICYGDYELEAVRRLDRRAELTGSGITGYVAVTGSSVLCEDTAADPRYLHGISDARTSMTVPLRLSEHVLGTLNVEAKQLGAFGEEDLKYLEVFAHFVAGGLHTADLLEGEEIVSVRRVAEIIADRINNALGGLVTNLYLLKQNYIQDRSFIGILDVMERQIDQLVGELKGTIKLDRVEDRPGIEVCPDIVKERYTGLTALVAEDQDHMRKALVKILELWGFHCDSASDGAEAIRLIESRRYDLILSDVMMPRRSGKHVFAAAQRVMPDTPVVFITGGYDPTHASVELPAAAVLYKPFKVTQLQETICEVLGPRRAQEPGDDA